MVSSTKFLPAEYFPEVPKWYWLCVYWESSAVPLQLHSQVSCPTIKPNDLYLIVQNPIYKSGRCVSNGAVCNNSVGTQINTQSGNDEMNMMCQGLHSSHPYVKILKKRFTCLICFRILFGARWPLADLTLAILNTL